MRFSRQALAEIDLAQVRGVHVSDGGDTAEREFAGAAKLTVPDAQRPVLGQGGVLGHGTARHVQAYSTAPRRPQARSRVIELCLKTTSFIHGFGYDAHCHEGEYNAHGGPAAQP